MSDEDDIFSDDDLPTPAPLSEPFPDFSEQLPGMSADESSNEFPLPDLPEAGDQCFEPPPMMMDFPETNLYSIQELPNNINDDPLYAPEPARESPSRSSNERMQETARSAPIGNAKVPASFPFTVKIEGALKDCEKDKLVSIVVGNKMGISEVELEPQLKSNRILIPRISEFAAILIAQSLRDANAHITIGPSDQVFSTLDTASTPDDVDLGYFGFEKFNIKSDSPLHKAEMIPLISGAEVPGFRRARIIASVAASRIIKTIAVQAHDSREYLEALEALSKEIQYKAHQKGAHLVLQFSSTLTRLDRPDSYRILALGSAAVFEDN